MAEGEGTVDRTAIPPLALTIAALLMAGVLVAAVGFDEEPTAIPFSTTTTSEPIPTTVPDSVTSTTAATTATSTATGPTTTRPAGPSTTATAPCGTGTASGLVAVAPSEPDDEQNPTSWTTTISPSAVNQSHPDPIQIIGFQVEVTFTNSTTHASTSRVFDVSTQGVVVPPGGQKVDFAPITTTTADPATSSRVVSFQWYPVGRPECVPPES